MDFKPLFYACLVLCVVAFFDVLFTLRKNSMLKICFLFIIASLFVMNYFSYISVENRLQFLLVKTMRLIYACSAMLSVVYLVTPKIPRWIIFITGFGAFFLTGMRLVRFREIDIESQLPFANQVFSVGQEFYAPSAFLRTVALILVSIAISITFYYYRKFFLKINKEAVHYKHLTRWVISFVVPFFVLTIFGVLGVFNVFQQSASPYLFSFFSCTIILSIFFRPRYLNTTSYFADQEYSIINGGSPEDRLA